jgi:hypothetical protein
MELIYKLAMWAHVAAGITALVLAPLAMAVRKGGTTHRRWGKVYFWAMAGIFATALVMLLVKPMIFLLAVAVLSFYGALTGYRALYRKRPELQPAGLLDWAATTIALLVAIALLAWGAGWIELGMSAPGYYRTLGLIFGVLIALNAVKDVRSLQRPPTDRHAWWYLHMDRMLGSYIGLTTAFLVQTVAPRLVEMGMSPNLAAIVWVLPAAVGIPLSGMWINAYRRRFSGHQQRVAMERASGEA